ncbi:MAG: ATP-binding cassette domain-containing protein [Filifactoraceae bacterium]
MKNKKYIFITIVSLFILLIIAPSQDISIVNLSNTFSLPSFDNYLGTDHLGRDILSLLKFASIRTMEVILISSVISLSFGLILGILSGYYENNVETLITLLIDVIMIIPSFMVALIFSSIFGLQPFSCGLLFGITGIGNYMYQTAALTKKIKKEEFIISQKLLGFSDVYILRKHILKNVSPPILNTFGSKACNVILSYASLSFIGLGTDISQPDWGALLYQYRSYIIEHPILILWPTLGIFLIATLFHVLFDSNKEQYLKPKNEYVKSSSCNIETTKILQVNNLSVNIMNSNMPKPIIKNISFSIDEGEKLAILGESGSGKTMLVSALVDLIDKSYINVSGEILFNSKKTNILSLKEKYRKLLISKNISFIFQDSINVLNPYYKISSQLYKAAKIHRGFTGVEAQEYISELLNSLSFNRPENILNKYPHECSGGMLQRVAIALALTQNPKIIIADEPSSSLDTINKERLDLLLFKHCEKLGIALIYISHDISAATKLCQRILVLKDGVIVDEGQSDMLIKKSTNPYTQQIYKASSFLLNKNIKPSCYNLQQESSQTLLHVTSLTQKYINHIEPSLKDISFTLEQGEILGILGKSGSGKTTLSRCIINLLNYTGTIIFDKNDISKLDKCEMKNFRTNTQMIFQSPINSFDPKQQIKEALLNAPLYHGLFSTTDEATKKLLYLLEECGLNKTHLNRYPCELSGGQLQRMSIVRALMLNPKLLIADESLSSLDVVTQIQVLSLLEKIVRDHKLSLIFISHDPKLIYKLCSRVMIIKDGKITEIGDTQYIFQNPQTQYTSKLLSCSYFNC